MVVNGVRDRYRVDLIGLQAACEANYARLMRLLPEMREQPGPRQIAVTQGDQMLGVLTLEVILDCPYTSTLRVSQQHSLPWLPVPQLQVQVYHDARMAEVVAAEWVKKNAHKGDLVVCMSCGDLYKAADMMVGK